MLKIDSGKQSEGCIVLSNEYPEVGRCRGDVRWNSMEAGSQ
jgi:hypothetical protein